MDSISHKPSKIVDTFDLNGKKNGYLLELGKNGKKTTSYLTVALPGCFKGYHMHVVRASNYVCIKGRVNVLMFRKDIPDRLEIEMSADKPSQLTIPIDTPTAISNPYEDEGWLINVPDPPYDPDLLHEQVDMNEDQVREWLRND